MTNDIDDVSERPRWVTIIMLRSRLSACLDNRTRLPLDASPSQFKAVKAGEKHGYTFLNLVISALFRLG